MSKVSEIRWALSRLEPGGYQELCNALLHARGYRAINALGTALSSPKTRKGIPDTYVPQADGTYVFAEFTTQEANLFAKLSDDVEKTLDAARTGVPVEQLSEIVLCYLGQISPDKHLRLAQTCKTAGVQLTLIGIHEMAFDLAQKYPGLARDHLGIEVDTQQILTSDQFVRTADQNKLAASLATPFHGRQVELATGLAALESRDLLILSGPPGVGKSRLALELAARFCSARPDWEAWFVISRDQDIYSDLRSYFSRPGRFLLVVDDANRLLRFEYVLELLGDRRTDQELKVIATVRDYALTNLRRTAQSSAPLAEVRLERLANDQLRELVRTAFGVQNYHYLDRIVTLASGNPRLAAMASTLAIKTQSLDSIRDATALYDAYFDSIAQDLEEMGDPELLRVAGVVGLLRAIDRRSTNQVTSIASALGIGPEDFWSRVRSLHDLEVVDMYSDDLVRSADQVLATYLLYRCIVRERSFDFYAVLRDFFPRFRTELVEALAGVFHAFDPRVIRAVVDEPILRRWRELEESRDPNFVAFMETFAAFNPTATLLHVRHALDSEPPTQVANPESLVRLNTGVPVPQSLQLLANLRHADHLAHRDSIELLLSWAAKRRSDVSAVIRLLAREFGFSPQSQLIGVHPQALIFDAIWARWQHSSDSFFAEIFLTLASEYLDTEFEVNEAAGRNALSWTRFVLAPSAEVFEFRKSLWQRVLSLTEVSLHFRGRVLQLLRAFTQQGLFNSSNDLLAKDLQSIVTFIGARLDPASHCDCLAVQELATFFDSQGIEFPIDVSSRFQCPTLQLFRLLVVDFHAVRSAGGFSEYQRQHEAELRSYAATLEADDIPRLITQTKEVYSHLPQGVGWDLPNAFTLILTSISERDPELFESAVVLYLRASDFLRVSPFVVTKALLSTRGQEPTQRIFQGIESDEIRQRWLFAYYHSLPESSLNAVSLGSLLALYSTAPIREIPLNLEPLARFVAIDPSIFSRVTEILLNRMREQSTFAPFALLFNKVRSPSEGLWNLFGGDPILKRAYLAQIGRDSHADFDGSILAHLVEHEPEFLFEFAASKIRDKEWIGGFEDTRTYDFIWRRVDAPELMERVLLMLVQQEAGKYSFGFTSLAAYFQLTPNRAPKPPEVIDRQDEFLKAMVRKFAGDSAVTRTLFLVIKDLEPERRRACIAVFLSANRDLESFKMIHIEPTHMTWSGSAVSMFEKRLEFLESVRLLLAGVEFLEHRAWMEVCIDGIRQQIEQERRRDFLDS